MVVAPVNSGRQ